MAKIHKGRNVEWDNSAPGPQLEKPRNVGELEAALASSLYLAGESLAPNALEEPTNYAKPDNNRSAPIVDEFDWLKTLVMQFRQALIEDPKRAELLHLLPQGLGDGEILRVLFGNLFPT